MRGWRTEIENWLPWMMGAMTGLLIVITTLLWAILEAVSG